MQRTLTLVLSTLALVVLLVASGVLDVQWRDNAAEAVDLDKLFDDEDPEKTTGEKKNGGDIFEGQPESQQALPPSGAPPSFADLAQHSSPAVVNIQTSRKIKTGKQRAPFPFEDFFGGPFEEFFEEREFQIPSLGSGFVISTDGYIVTNNHVIEEVDSIKVAFLDGTQLEAEVVGRDPKTDIALIRVKSEKKLPMLPLGDSDNIRTGDWVVAIGNPYGLEHTVTAGIVSAKHRIIGQGSYDDFIQTDAAINPGNSGGPLLNLAGEVVGINTAINPRANTIGFAVPINMAKDVLPQLKSEGSVTRGWLGVVIQRITPELAESLGLEEDRGALVSKVDPEGPAAKAGIERGDVIIRFNDHKIEKMEELPRVVAMTPVGQEVEVVVLRRGKQKTFSVPVGRLEEPTLTAQGEEPHKEGLEAFGLYVQDLTPELAEQLGLEGEVTAGVVITSIERNSPAAVAGLRRGDVILEINQAEVRSVKDLKAKLTEDKDSALLLVQRGSAALYVALKRGGGTGNGNGNGGNDDGGGE